MDAKGGYLVNTSRGEVVDTAAIPDAIASGRLAGAGIDVLAEEPPSPENLSWSPGETRRTPPTKDC